MNRFFLYFLFFYLLALGIMSILMIVVDTTDFSLTLHKYFFFVIFLGMVFNTILATSFYHLFKKYLVLTKYILSFVLLCALSVLFIALVGLKTLSYNKIFVGSYDVYSLGLTLAIILIIVLLLLLFSILRGSKVTLINEETIGPSQNDLASEYIKYIYYGNKNENDIKKAIKEYNKDQPRKLNPTVEITLLDKEKKRYNDLVKERKIVKLLPTSNLNNWFVTHMKFYTENDVRNAKVDNNNLKSYINNYVPPQDLRGTRKEFKNILNSFGTADGNLTKLNLIIKGMKLIDSKREKYLL